MLWQKVIYPTNFNPLRGFRDYYPKDWREVRENLFLKAQEVAESFGFEQIVMPVIERTEFLLKKSGEEIKEQIFNVLPKKTLILINRVKEIVNEINEKSNEKIGKIEVMKTDSKGTLKLEDLNKDVLLKNNKVVVNFGDENYLIKVSKEGGGVLLIDESSLNPEMSLRFDLTMPAIRMAMKRWKELTKPVKWFYIDKNFRYEEPQKGRDREFFQIGVEFYGVKDSIADLEVLNFAITFLNKIGLEKKFKVKINNRKLMDYLISQILKSEQRQDLFRLIDKIRKISEADFKKEAMEILKDEGKVNVLFDLVKKPLSLEEAEEFIKKEVKDDNLKERLLKEIELLKLLSDKAYLEYDLSIVRGLDYYTGLVFEFYDLEEKYRALAGGGRYDNLAESLGFKEKVYATGLALGPSVLEIFMKENNLWKKRKSERDFIVIAVSKNELNYAYKVAEELRDKGFKVEFSYKKGIAKNLDYANKLNAKFAIIIGENEVKENTITLKNLETGEEVKVNKDLFLERAFIDKIDSGLNELLNKRFETILRIKKIKEAHNLKVEDKNKEEVVIGKFKDGKFEKEKEEIIKKIIEKSKEIQSNQK